MEDAKERAACTGTTYASPPSENLVSVDFQLRVELPSYSQPIRLCVLLDGKRLLSDDEALDAARRLALGETITIHGAVTPGGRHQVVLRAGFHGPEPYRGYHFAVRSDKSLVVPVTEGRPILDMRLFELPVPQLERRPNVEWSASGPITLHRD